MADQADVRRIALALPAVSEEHGRFAFSVQAAGKSKAIAWVWMERVAPGKPRVPRPDVMAVRVADVGEQAALIALDPHRFFTEPHYSGFPAVLVRLPEVDVATLEALLTSAWRIQAPKRLQRTLAEVR